MKIPGYCEHCGDVTVTNNETDPTLHMVLLIFTCGLWSIVWLILAICESTNPWRCEVCGRIAKRERARR